MIKIKRIYDKPQRDDGFRVLVDRLWPRGLKKEDAHVNLWLKDIAPSAELRRWFAHDPAKWPEFQMRYRDELDLEPETVRIILEKAAEQTVTLLYAAKSDEMNNAVLLRDYLEESLASLSR